MYAPKGTANRVTTTLEVPAASKSTFTKKTIRRGARRTVIKNR
jgi:hypothetical protein